MVGLLGGIAIFGLTPFVPDTALGFRSVADTRHVGGNGLGVVELPDIQHELHLTSFTVQMPPAGEGEVTLAFTRLEPMQNGFHYEAWAVFNTNVLSLAKFNVGPAGEMVDLQGHPIPGGRFALAADAASATDVAHHHRAAGRRGRRAFGHPLPRGESSRRASQSSPSPIP